MRCLFRLVGFVGILFVLHTNQSLAASKVSAEAVKINYLVNTSHPPLSAIQNSPGNASGFINNYPIYLQKRFGIYFIAGNQYSLRSVELLPNNDYHFFDKSTSLFLLNQYSQSLWGVFLR